MTFLLNIINEFHPSLGSGKNMIKNLEINDIDLVIELLSKNRPYVVPHHKYQYWILSKYHSMTSYVFIESNRIVGFLGCLQSSERNSIFIWQICVDENHRNKGIAKKLLNKLVLAIKELEISVIDLSITEGNEASKALFVKFAKSISSELIQEESIEINDDKENVYKIEIKSN